MARACDWRRAMVVILRRGALQAAKVYASVRWPGERGGPDEAPERRNQRILGSFPRPLLPPSDSTHRDRHRLLTIGQMTASSRYPFAGQNVNSMDIMLTGQTLARISIRKRTQ